MKKSIIFATATILTLSLSGCGGNSSETLKSEKSPITSIKKTDEQNVNSNDKKSYTESDSKSYEQSKISNSGDINSMPKDKPTTSVVSKSDTSNSKSVDKSVNTNSDATKLTTKSTISPSIGTSPATSNTKSGVIAKSENIISSKESKELLEQIDLEIDNSFNTINASDGIDESQLTEP